MLHYKQVPARLFIFVTEGSEPKVQQHQEKWANAVLCTGSCHSAGLHLRSLVLELGRGLLYLRWRAQSQFDLGGASQGHTGLCWTMMGVNCKLSDFFFVDLWMRVDDTVLDDGEWGGRELLMRSEAMKGNQDTVGEEQAFVTGRSLAFVAGP